MGLTLETIPINKVLMEYRKKDQGTMMAHLNMEKSIIMIMGKMGNTITIITRKENGVNNNNNKGDLGEPATTLPNKELGKIQHNNQALIHKPMEFNLKANKVHGEHNLSRIHGDPM
jgi:hypothetical protein